MNKNDKIYEKANLRSEEIAALELRALYEQNGYRKYRMSRFEEYSLYANNRDFLAGDKVLTFTDLDGRLMALKPDVTMSIIKNTENSDTDPEKLYYVENVYRESRESNSFREIRQIGLEMIGTVETPQIAEVLGMAAKTLATVGDDFVLEVSHMGFTEELLRTMALTGEDYAHILRLISDKNPDGVRKVAAEAGVPAAMIDKICALTSLDGAPEAVLAAAEQLAVNGAMMAALQELGAVCRALEATGLADHVRMDLSMVNDIDYYNGVIFKGYFRNSAARVLAGGQYDRAMRKLGREAGAIGFALYLDEIARMEEVTVPDTAADWLTIALPKGRLGDQVYEILSRSGYACSAYEDKNRKLVVEDPDNGVRYILVKPSDVPVYVEHQAADVGIVGKDILMEHAPDVYELMDLGIGKCRMCVCGPEESRELLRHHEMIRVASKYPNIAREYFYNRKHQTVDIIKLNGSVELGPIVDLGDVIVDIVETGSTLKENGLTVLEEVCPISARMIVNQVSMQMKTRRIREIMANVRDCLE